MKRIVSGILAVFLLVPVLGCRQSRQERVDTENSIDSTLNANVVSPDYDKNGKLILFSTKERPVIKTSFGYYILQFDGNNLSSLMVVYDKETAEEAQTLYDTMTAPGYNQTDFLNIVLNDQYVVCTVAEDSARYGYLFGMKKLEILNFFYSNKNAES